MTNFNERIHFFIKIYISHTLFSKGWCLLCVRDELETGTDCYIDPSSSLDIAALLPHLGWGFSTVGHWGPKALCLPLALTSVSCLQLTWTVCAPDYIIVYRPPASAVLPLIYTGESLDWRLGRGSIYNIHTFHAFRSEVINFSRVIFFFLLNSNFSTRCSLMSHTGYAFFSFSFFFFYWGVFFLSRGYICLLNSYNRAVEFFF